MGVESLTFARRRARRLYVRVRLAEVRVWSPDAVHVQINGRWDPDGHCESDKSAKNNGY